MICRAAVRLPVAPRPANALCVEVGTPAPRCLAKQPAHWPPGMALRWLASGGEYLVFGACDGACEAVAVDGEGEP